MAPIGVARVMEDDDEIVASDATQASDGKPVAALTRRFRHTILSEEILRVEISSAQRLGRRSRVLALAVISCFAAASL
jgi:hypothetical protein